MKKQKKYHRVPYDLFERGWSNEAVLLAFFLLTNRWRITEGLYKMPKTLMCSELDWSRKRLEKVFRELEQAGFVQYDDSCGVVLLCEALHYQSCNKNMAKHAIRMLRQLPSTPLLFVLYGKSIDYATALTACHPLPPSPLTGHAVVASASPESPAASLRRDRLAWASRSSSPHGTNAPCRQATEPPATTVRQSTRARSSRGSDHRR